MSVRVHRSEQVLRLELDRPEAGNRLDGAAIDVLRRELANVGGEGGPDVVILGATGRDFCLGRERTDAAVTPENLAREFGRIQEVNELIEMCPAVTVAALHGQVLGAGLSLAARCDIVVAAEDAILAFPEVPHGIPPTIVLSHYTYALQRKHLMDLILTGREIDVREGQNMGLVSRVAPAAELDRVVNDLVEMLTSYDQRSIRLVKTFVQSLTGVSPRDAPRLGIAMYINEMVGRALTEQGDSDD